MKKTFAIGILFLTGLPLVALKTHAQGTMYISNLDHQTTGSLSVGGDAWFAGWFQTGSSPGGYALNAIQLSMASSGGNPNDFAVMLWDFQRDQSMADLTGPDPLLNGVFEYVSAGFMLAPSTVYWFAVTSETPVATGSYQLNYTSFGLIHTNSWTLGGAYQTSSDGAEWNRIDPLGTIQFAVFATPIPEPSTLALYLCGGAVWLAARGRWRAACAVKRTVPTVEKRG